MRTSESTKERAGRVAEAVAIAAAGKVMDVTVERWKARQAHRISAQERIEALETRVAMLADRVATLEAAVQQGRAMPDAQGT